MKILDSTYLEALNAELQTLTNCWLITRRDNTQVGFTDFDRALTFDGITYTPVGGFKQSNNDRDISLNADTVTLESYFSTQVSEIDLITGQFDGARAQYFRVNYLSLPTDLGAYPPKHEILIDGFFGKVTSSDSSYSVQISGLPKLLENKINWVTSETCRYEFCDSKCGLDIADFTLSLEVATINSAQKIFVAGSYPVNHFVGGKLTWTSGPNTGLTVGVLTSDPSEIGLTDPMPTTPDFGDEFDITINCQKYPSNCKSFGNYLNFGGEKLPTEDSYLSSTDQG